MNEYNEYVAAQLLILLKEHKDSCKSSTCSVSLGSFRLTYEKLMNRAVTEEELVTYFM